MNNEYQTNKKKINNKERREASLKPNTAYVHLVKD